MSKNTGALQLRVGLCVHDDSGTIATRIPPTPFPHPHPMALSGLGDLPYDLFCKHLEPLLTTQAKMALFGVSKACRNLVTQHLPRQTLVYISDVNGPVCAKHATGPQYRSVHRPCLDHYCAPQLASPDAPSELTVDFFVQGRLPNRIPVQQFLDKVAAVCARVPWKHSPMMYQPVGVLRVLNAQLKDGYVEQLLSNLPAEVCTSLRTLCLQGQLSHRHFINRPPFSFVGGQLPNITSIQLTNTPADLKDIALGLPHLTSLDINCKYHEVIGWSSLALLTRLQRLWMPRYGETDLIEIQQPPRSLSSLAFTIFMPERLLPSLCDFSRLHTLNLQSKAIWQNAYSEERLAELQTNLDTVASGSQGVRNLSLVVPVGISIPTHWDLLEKVEVMRYTQIPQLPTVTSVSIIESGRDAQRPMTDFPPNLQHLDAPFDMLIHAIGCHSLQELTWKPADQFPLSQHAALLVAASVPGVWSRLDTLIVCGKTSEEHTDVYNMQLCEILAAHQHNITHVTVEQDKLRGGDVSTLCKMPLVSVTIRRTGTKLRHLSRLVADRENMSLKLVLLQNVRGVTASELDGLRMECEQRGVLVRVQDE